MGFACHLGIGTSRANVCFLMQSTGTEDYFIRHFFKSRRPEKNVQEQNLQICKTVQWEPKKKRKIIIKLTTPQIHT